MELPFKYPPTYIFGLIQQQPFCQNSHVDCTAFCICLHFDAKTSLFITMKDELEKRSCKESIQTCHIRWCLRDRIWRLLWMLIRAAVIRLHVFPWKQTIDNGLSVQCSAAQPLFPGNHSCQWLYLLFYQPCCINLTRPAVACCPRV